MNSQQRRSGNNSSRPKKSLTNSRKRSHSSASSSSPESANNIFSAASSSDSGSSSMISTIRTQTKKKRSHTKDDNDSSSADSSSSSMMATPQPPITAPTTTSFSSNLPPKLTAQRSVPAFLNKLYNMVEDPSTTDLIRWSKDGNSFIVERHEEFAKTVLPRFYKHNTFASFVRQLNMYDFHKVPHLQQGVLIAESEHEIWEFSNPHFQRGRPDLLVLVTRKRNRDKDAIDTENISLATLVSDLSNIKKQQASIGTDLRELHRDNEILWQETLNAREKYQRHQEAIEKIIQFLTTIFSNDRLAISINNPDALPKGLIEEAANLAGMSTGSKIGSFSNNKTGTYSSYSSSALSAILSSVLRLYSTQPPPSPITDARPISGQHHTNNSRNSFFQPSASPRTAPQENLENETLLNSFSKTLNTATRSARTISEDIDVLQTNIESLAQNLGLDPSQFNDDLDGLRSHFQEQYSDMIDSANQDDKAKLFALVDNNINGRLNNMFMHPKEDPVPQADLNLGPAIGSSPARLHQTHSFQVNPLPTSPTSMQSMQQQHPVQNNNKSMRRQSHLSKSTDTAPVTQRQQQASHAPPPRASTYPMMVTLDREGSEKNPDPASANNNGAAAYRPPYLLSMNYPTSFGPSYANNHGKGAGDDDGGPEREYSSSRGGNMNSTFNPHHHQLNNRKGYMDCYQDTNKGSIPDQTTIMMPVQAPIDIARQQQNNYAHMQTQAAYNDLAQQDYRQFDDDNNYDVHS